MKILLVDDHALIRDALRGVVTELADEPSVLEASDARQAMQLIHQHPDLHLVLLDLNLPDRDGLGVLADLRRRYAPISVVVLSASHDQEKILKALDLGANTPVLACPVGVNDDVLGHEMHLHRDAALRRLLFRTLSSLGYLSVAIFAPVAGSGDHEMMQLSISPFTKTSASVLQRCMNEKRCGLRIQNDTISSERVSGQAQLKSFGGGHQAG